jgi:hypothetical protein
VKDRGILFSRDMVHALLAGRKTQTRRLAKGLRAWDLNEAFLLLGDSDPLTLSEVEARCPYGVPGDRLYVRESWRHTAFHDMAAAVDESHVGPCYEYAADFPETTKGWKPSIHLPRRGSRILLEVTGVRVEQLNDISEADAKAEGVTIQEVDGMGCYVDYELGDGTWCNSARGSFSTLWDSINGERAPWSANPWVWVVSFTGAPKAAT